MINRYVPIVRWKRGERVGIQNLSNAAREDVFPLFVLGTDQFVGRKATKNHAAIPAPQVVAMELRDIWGNGPFYLDALALPIAPAGHHPIVDIAAHARALGLNLIPATRLSALADYRTAVDAIVALDRRGVLLRVDLEQFSKAATWSAAGWSQPVADTDLVLDFEDNVGLVSGLGPALDHAFAGLHGADLWRSVAMCGTSMPENFSGHVAGTFTIPRAEYTLWAHLSSLGLPYQLDYSDYTTVSVAPAPSGIKWGFPINVRYTLQQDFLICRGVGTTGPGAQDMDVQLVAHANSIVRHAGRGALPHCWADIRIDAIAAGTIGPQALEHWVQLGVNRHIELVRSILP